MWSMYHTGSNTCLCVCSSFGIYLELCFQRTQIDSKMQLTFFTFHWYSFEMYAPMSSGFSSTNSRIPQHAHDFIDIPPFKLSGVYMNSNLLLIPCYASIVLSFFSHQHFPLFLEWYHVFLLDDTIDHYLPKKLFSLSVTTDRSLSFVFFGVEFNLAFFLGLPLGRGVWYMLWN
jgi:hypothetical protein